MANWWDQDEVVEPREKLDEKRAAKDAEWIDTLRSDAGVAREVAPMATQFLGYNQGTGTGGILTKMGGGWGPIPALDNRQGRQAMEGLTSAMMRATRIIVTHATVLPEVRYPPSPGTLSWIEKHQAGAIHCSRSARGIWPHQLVDPRDDFLQIDIRYARDRVVRHIHHAGRVGQYEQIHEQMTNLGVAGNRRIKDLSENFCEHLP